MADSSNQITTHELWIDGRKMSVDVQQNASNTSQLIVTWTLPPTPYNAFDGFLVLLSTSPFGGEHTPEDGKKYIPSSNWAAPADVIGDAQVIAAAYGYFGDNITTTTVTVSNTDPTKLYYASIHAASNVLQYYPIGIQSYPLESSRYEKSSDSYAGSIPTASLPPQNPVNGEVYFDTNSGKVLMWKADQQAWIDTSDSTVNVGERPSIVPKQMFYNQVDQALRFFIGGMWIDCNAINTRVKYGTTWVPLGTTTTQPTYPETPNPGDVIQIRGIVPLANNYPPIMMKVFTLGQWLSLSPDLLQIETSPGVWANPLFGDMLFGSEDPKIPKAGDFFYRTVGKDLLVWNGEDWTKADTEAEGTPTSDKIGIGNDGSYDERLRLIKVLKGQMGWPSVCIELNEEQFNIAIDNALETFRQRADNAYAHRYVMFTLQPNQQTYYLNDPRTKTDRIVNILKIGRVNTLGAAQLNDPVYGQLFLPQVFSPGTIDLVSIHLMHQLSETFEKIFAGNLIYTWDEASRNLVIHRHIPRHERVVMECVMERTEQELLLDRWCKQWLQGWALAELKETLGLIRSKYSSVAGPNGGVTLNGDMLLSEARLDFEDLQRQLLDHEVGNGGQGFANTSFFIM
jgi:hypothetical protein